MLNGKIDTEGMKFNYVLTDVEELNKNAFNAITDITKISYHAYSYVAGNYILMNSGSALGFNNGPLLVSASAMQPDDLAGKRIAIPGRYTTANLLLSIVYPELADRHEYLFSDIEDIVLRGEASAGLLIHENRFTYRQKGLHRVADLGKEWDKITGMPIPLGGIAIKRELGQEIAEKVERVLTASIKYAFANPRSSHEFVKKYAATMERDVMQQHIDLYVNDFSRNLGDLGRKAVNIMYEKGRSVKAIPEMRPDIFLGYD